MRKFRTDFFAIHGQIERFDQSIAFIKFEQVHLCNMLPNVDCTWHHKKAQKLHKYHHEIFHGAKFLDDEIESSS